MYPVYPCIPKWYCIPCVCVCAAHRQALPYSSRSKACLLTATDSFPVPTYLFLKGDERLGRNDVKVAGQDGKGERKVGSSPIFVRPSLDAMRSSQNRLRSDWERVCAPPRKGRHPSLYPAFPLEVFQVVSFLLFFPK